MGRKEMLIQQGRWVRGSSFVTQEESSFDNTQSKGGRERGDTEEGSSSSENQFREEGGKVSQGQEQPCHH